MRLFSLFLCVALLGFAPSLAWSADSTPKPLTEAEKAQIEDVVREFLIKKEPETVMKAVQEMQKKEDSQRLVQGKSAVTKNHDKLFNDAKSPVGGNLKGDVTVIEFFDYQCGYCKMAEEAVVKLLAEDKNVRFVYKEFPILGAGSTLASKAALASVKQDKYAKFHNALMMKKEHFSEDVIDQIAKDVGLNLDKLHKDMASDEIEQIINANLSLGGEIGARGTPMFIIGDKLIPGAVGVEVLKQTVDEVRKAKK